MLERYFKSFTKDNDEEYSVEVHRINDDFTANVKGKFGDKPEFARTFTASGPDAEQAIQKWLVELDEEVRATLEVVVEPASSNAPTSVN